MGGIFKTLLDWKFDPVRSTRDRGFRKNKNHIKIIERDLLEYELFNEKSDILELVIPPKTSSYSRELYSILIQHIDLVQGEFGVGFRESRADLARILKEYDIDYRIVKPIVDDIEYRYLVQFNDESDKIKSKN